MTHEHSQCVKYSKTPFNYVDFHRCDVVVTDCVVTESTCIMLAYVQNYQILTS